MNDDPDSELWANENKIIIIIKTHADINHKQIYWAPYRSENIPSSPSHPSRANKLTRTGHSIINTLLGHRMIHYQPNNFPDNEFGLHRKVLHFELGLSKVHLDDDWESGTQEEKYGAFIGPFTI